MLIRDWMTTDVITATPETSMLKVSKMMKEYDIRRVPVVDAQNKVVGIVSDRDVKDASPSKATTLDMHELYYLLSEIKVRDIMTPDPVTVEVRDTVERVALLMEERAIGGLPVVDDEGSLVGIITDHDIFKVLVQITGVRHGGVQVALAVEDLPGVMRPIFDLLREYDASLISMLSSATGARCFCASAPWSAPRKTVWWKLCASVSISCTGCGRRFTKRRCGPASPRLFTVPTAVFDVAGNGRLRMGESAVFFG